jgi:hypothetical protein
MVGARSADGLQTGILNTYVGYDSGRNGDRNTVVGSQSGNLMQIAATNNTILGSSTGKNLLTGTQNTILGGGAGEGLSQGNLNTFIGFAAGRNGERNTVVGSLAGNSLTNASFDNTVVGISAGDAIQNGFQNTILGAYAGNTIALGGKNTVLGATAGFGLTGGSLNTYVGFGSGNNGQRNTIVGSLSGPSMTITATENTIVGYRSGNTGSRNTIVGSSSGISLDSTSEYNTIIGSDSAPLLTSGVSNMIIGDLAALDFITGDFNILMGYNSGQGMTTGNNNVCIAEGATTKGSDCLVIGKNAGLNSTGDKNIFIGEESGADTQGSDNLGVGALTRFGNATLSTYIGRGIFTGEDLTSPLSVITRNIGVGRIIEFGTSFLGAYRGNIKDTIGIGSDLLFRPVGGAVTAPGIHDVITVGQNITVNRGNTACVFGRNSTITNKSNLVTLCNSNNFLTLDERGNLTITGSDATKNGGSINWITTSDRRLKSNIHLANTITCENFMRKLDLKRFTWNDNETVRDKTQLGFIAQEVEELLPKSVSTREFANIPDCKLLDTSQIMMTMYGALKRCISRIDELEKVLARNNIS